MADQCLFCRILRGEIPATIVAETDDCVAFRDITPRAPVHVLVIPRQHVASLDEATDAAQIGKLSLLAARIAREEGRGPCTRKLSARAPRGAACGPTAGSLWRRSGSSAPRCSR